MAQRVVVELLDDIDQTPATSTVNFGLDGKIYTIDLNSDHAAELRGLLDKYVAAGRKVGTHRSALRPSKRQHDDFDPAAVRAWASSNGIPVSTRGRVPAKVVAKYHAAGY
ncbi:MAG: Lsr2 family protein [Micrococcales bacterium]|nr:Lsr2 family protein [Micrococcales bacterium]